MRHEIKRFTNEELAALSDKGISPHTAYHLQSFLRTIAENIGGQFKKNYWDEAQTEHGKYDGP